MGNLGHPHSNGLKKSKTRSSTSSWKGSRFEISSGRIEEGPPSIPTFFKHLRDSDSFAKRYARAREFQADIEFEKSKRFPTMAGMIGWKQTTPTIQAIG